MDTTLKPLRREVDKTDHLADHILHIKRAPLLQGLKSDSKSVVP